MRAEALSDNVVLQPTRATAVARRDAGRAARTPLLFHCHSPLQLLSSALSPTTAPTRMNRENVDDLCITWSHRAETPDQECHDVVGAHRDGAECARLLRCSRARAAGRAPRR